MNDLVKKFVDEGHILPIQLILLVANIYVVEKCQLNNYLLLSLILVLSTLVLQTIRRRFRLLYPFNVILKRPADHWDTHYLRIVFLLSTTFLILGVCLAYEDRFAAFNKTIGKNIHFLILIIIVLIPIFFWMCSNLLNKKLADKLKSEGSSFDIGECPSCGKKAALYERSVSNEKEIVVDIKCLKCDWTKEYKISASIGS